MNKIIIHSSYPRTASTWFQNNFYPKVVNYNFVNTKEFREFIQTQEINFNYKYDNNLIFCDEEIMNIKKNTLEIKDKAKKLKKNFPNATIIIFIRNQLTILESKYSFYVQSGGTMTINEMINNLFNTKKINQWNYFEQISIYTDLFGENNVKVYLYEDFKLNNKIFIQKYISTYGFKVEFDSINFSIKNYSLNKCLIKILRILNHFTKNKIDIESYNEKLLINIPYLFFFTRKIFFLVNKILPKRNVKLKKNITTNNYIKIINYFSESNQKLISEFNLESIKKYKYPL